MEHVSQPGTTIQPFFIKYKEIIQRSSHSESIKPEFVKLLSLIRPLCACLRDKASAFRGEQGEIWTLYDITFHHYPATGAAVSHPAEFKKSTACGSRTRTTASSQQHGQSIPEEEAKPRALRKMRVCVLQCCLALLGLSLVLCGNGASSQPDLDVDVDLDPRYRRLLQRARALGMAAQDWRKREMEDLLSQLTLPESEFKESEITSLGAKHDVRVELERSAENPNSLPPRERKAGCKNFYWKGFTSC
ncbi:hypothetical protein MHYP_G00204450 [Metynnis hypsauchen]